MRRGSACAGPGAGIRFHWAPQSWAPLARGTSCPGTSLSLATAERATSCVGTPLSVGSASPGHIRGGWVARVACLFRAKPGPGVTAVMQWILKDSTHRIADWVGGVPARLVPVPVNRPCRAGPGSGGAATPQRVPATRSRPRKRYSGASAALRCQPTEPRCHLRNGLRPRHDRAVAIPRSAFIRFGEPSPR
jgi:hypothetical protein